MGPCIAGCDPRGRSRTLGTLQTRPACETPLTGWEQRQQRALLETASQVPTQEAKGRFLQLCHLPSTRIPELGLAGTGCVIWASVSRGPAFGPRLPSLLLSVSLNVIHYRGIPQRTTGTLCEKALFLCTSVRFENICKNKKVFPTQLKLTKYFRC